jgi:hypothetical protein
VAQRAVRALNNFGSDLLPEIEPLQDFLSFGQRFNAQNLPLWRAVATGGIPGLTATRPHSVDSPLFISVILAGFVPRCSLKRKTQKNLIAYPKPARDLLAPITLRLQILP